MSPKLRNNAVAAVFLAPLIFFYGLFYVYSFYFLIKTSFFKTDMSLRHSVFVGLKNYTLLLTHDQFFTAIANTFVYAIVGIVAGLTLGFFIAIALSTGRRGSRFYYAIFFLPSLMPMALVASVFSVMLEYRYGMLNTIIRTIGLDPLAQRWLVNPTWAYVSVISIFVYIIGLPIMYYTADLSVFDISLIEAAIVDGAGAWQLIRLVIFPLLRGAHKTITLSVLLGSFRAFEIVFLSTGGGPSGKTAIVGTYLYDFATSGLNVGYVSAASIIVLIIALGIAHIQLSLYNRSEAK